jgi:hypothetical protein
MHGVYNVKPTFPNHFFPTQFPRQIRQYKYTTDRNVGEISSQQERRM